MQTNSEVMSDVSYLLSMVDMRNNKVLALLNACDAMDMLDSIPPSHRGRGAQWQKLWDKAYRISRQSRRGHQ